MHRWRPRLRETPRPGLPDTPPPISYQLKLSQKCQYAIRGVFEVARQHADRRPISASKVAVAQHIPKRFMEMIFNELKDARIIKSVRGARGGYLLNRKPSDISLGEIVRLIEGPFNEARCVSGKDACPFKGSCVFLDTWVEASRAVAKIFDHRTIQDFLDKAAANATPPGKPASTPITRARRRSAKAPA